MSLVTSITEVWNAILEWIVGTFTDIQGVFYNTGADGGSLTFLGVLAVISVGIGMVFLLIGVIQNFLHLRS